MHSLVTNPSKVTLDEGILSRGSCGEDTMQRILWRRPFVEEYLEKTLYRGAYGEDPM
jgi:hypothetical protein